MKNRRPPYSGAGEETAEVEAPPAKPPLGAEPTGRPCAEVTIRQALPDVYCE